MYGLCLQFYYMKKETGILLASSFGLIIGIGVFGLNKFFSKKHKKYQEYYSDFHRHFEKKKIEDPHHGIEYFAML